MVAVAPTCTFTGAAGTISDALPPAGPTPCLPTEFSAAHRDMASWTLWLFLTTLIRTLMSTHRILYPHILLIGVTSATLIRMTAWATTWRHWPWASTRVIPFIIVAEIGFMVGARVRVTGTGGVVGSRPCRKLILFRPQQLIMMDRDKSALHVVRSALDGEGQLDSPDPVLTDLRTPRAHLLPVRPLRADDHPQRGIPQAPHAHRAPPRGLPHQRHRHPRPSRHGQGRCLVAAAPQILRILSSPGMSIARQLAEDLVGRRHHLPSYAHQLWQRRRFVRADARAKVLGTQRGAFFGKRLAHRQADDRGPRPRDGSPSTHLIDPALAPHHAGAHPSDAPEVGADTHCFRVLWEKEKDYGVEG